MPPAARGHQTLSAYISARFDEFSRSQKDVAQYVVDHLDEVAFHTAEELARRANTSSSTVVRFSQALGFEGFPELQEAARDEYRHHHRAGSGNGIEMPLFSLDQSPFEQAVAADHVNVEDTARKVSRSEVDGAIEAIASADRILIAGTDQMAFFASYLRHLLMLLDVRAEIAASPSQEALSRLGRIDERTLVIGLSAGRPHPLVVRAMKIARHRKAATMAIVDATLSEVSKLASARSTTRPTRRPSCARTRACCRSSRRSRTGSTPATRRSTTSGSGFSGSSSRGCAEVGALAWAAYLMRDEATFRVKAGLAEMLKGGVIMDVVDAEQAKIAEEAGAAAVMALERVPADIRRDGGVARMSDPEMIKGIQEAVTIPVMAKARIGHFAEAQVLEALEVDYIDESEVLTPADEANHIDKWALQGAVRVRRDEPRRGAAAHRRGRGDDPLQGRGRHRRHRRGGPPPARDPRRDPPPADAGRRGAGDRREGAPGAARPRARGGQRRQAAGRRCSARAASPRRPTPRW